MMSRKKSPLIKTGDLDSLLGGKPQRTKPSSEIPPNQREHRRKTQRRAVSYRIGLDTRDRINRSANIHNVEKSSLVRFLLNHALTELENGTITLPTSRDTRPRKLD